VLTIVVAALAGFYGAFSIAVAAGVLACMRRRFTPLLVGLGLAAVAFAGPLVVLSSAAGGCREHYYESTECVRYG
jgi:hypothetical protein